MGFWRWQHAWAALIICVALVMALGKCLAVVS